MTKLKLVFTIVLSALLTNGFAQKTIKNTKAKKQTVVKKAPTYYFSDALVYELNTKGETMEIWFYYNPKTKLVLYLPNDDMIKGIVSFPDGNYKTFGITEAGKSLVINKKITDVVAKNNLDPALKSTADTKLQRQTDTTQPVIKSQGYYMKYLKMEGGETLFATTQVPINSKQIYGFCRLDGDSKLSYVFDYLNVFASTQLLSYIKTPEYTLTLKDISPTSYYFDTN